MKPFHFDEIDWPAYFAPQRGGSRFVGFPYQRGGNLFGLARFATSIIPAFLESPIGKRVASRAANVVREIRDGAAPLAALKRQSRLAVKDTTGLGDARHVTRKSRVIRKKKPSTRQSLFIPAL